MRDVGSAEPQDGLLVALAVHGSGVWRDMARWPRWSPTRGVRAIVPTGAMIAAAMTRAAELDERQAIEPKATLLPVDAEFRSRIDLGSRSGAKVSRPAGDLAITFRSREKRVSECLKRAGDSGRVRFSDRELLEICTGLGLDDDHPGRQEILRCGQSEPGSKRIDHHQIASWADQILRLEKKGEPGTGAANSDPVLVTWGHMPLAATAFQVRSRLMDQLAALPDQSATVIFTQQVLSGDGGLGKTQLAAHVLRTSTDDLRVWITASSRSAILSGYAEVYDRLGLGPREMPDDSKARRLLDHLQTTRRSWLLVLDDVPEWETIHGRPGTSDMPLWPVGPCGRGLVTSRWRPRMEEQSRVVIDVDVYTPGEAERYIRDRLQPYVDDGSLSSTALDESRELVDDLALHPAALAQSAAVIVLDRLTCSQYRVRFADVSRNLDDLFPVEADADQYGRTIATTWTLAIDRARRLHSAAPELLAILALLDPNDIPDRLLRSAAVMRYLNGNSGEISPVLLNAELPAQCLASIRALHAVSLVTWTPGRRSIHVHALTQRATRESTSPSNWPVGPAAQALQAMLQASVRAEEVIPVLTNIWHLWHIITRSTGVLGSGRGNPAQRLSRWVGRRLSIPSTSGPDIQINGLPAGGHGVFAQAAAAMVELGLLATAKTYVEDLYAYNTQRLGADHLNTLHVRSSLALWHGEAGRPEVAVIEYARVIDDLRRVVGWDHSYIWSARHNHAVWTGEAGDPHAAIAMFEKLLADYGNSAVASESHRSRARSQLARWLGEAGDERAAVSDLKAVLDDRLKSLGPDHPDTLTARHNLAIRRSKAGSPGAASNELSRLAPDRVRVLGASHPDTLLTRAELASIWGKTGDPERAIREYEGLMPELLMSLGPDHPQTLTAQAGMCRWIAEAGNLAQAIDCLERVLENRERVLGVDHPDTLMTRHNLAARRGQGGDLARAAADFEILLPIVARVFGQDHPRTAAARTNLAIWREHAGDEHGAVEALADLLSSHLRLVGADHPNCLTTRAKMANLTGASGDRPGAVRLLTSLHRDQVRILGHNHPATKETRRSISYWTSANPGGESLNSR